MPSRASTAAAAAETARMHGWVLAVSFCSSSGPSKHSLESFSPSAASTSSNSARASAKPSKRSLPMPTDCEP
jgi:hypothetical protein